MKQYSLKAGWKKLGDSGEEAVIKELNQVHNMETFFTMDPEELSHDQQVKAVGSLMFLKENLNGKLKWRSCANRSKQHIYIDKEYATSPTASTESLLITETIDAHERRNVAILETSGVYLHTETDEDFIMVLEGVLTALMAKCTLHFIVSTSPWISRVSHLFIWIYIRPFTEF